MATEAGRMLRTRLVPGAGREPRRRGPYEGRERTPPETIVIDMHLIGYTADLRYIVLDLDPGQRRGRYRLAIDLDLFLTLDEIRELRRAAGMEAGPRVKLVDERQAESAPVAAAAEEDSSAGEEANADVDHDASTVPDGHGDVDTPARGPDTEAAGGPEAPSGVDASSGVEPAATASAQEPAERSAPPAEPVSQRKRGTGEADTPQPESRLTPAEIQTLLRAGRTPKAVAKLAGIDVWRVERWLTPILAERAQVLHAAHATPLDSDAGPSRQPLAAATAQNLSARGVDPDRATWTVSRRVNGRWSVQLRYHDGDRVRCAAWSFDPRVGVLTAGSQLAHELGWTDEPGDRKEDDHTRSGRHVDDTVVADRLTEGAPEAAGESETTSQRFQEQQELWARGNGLVDDHG